MHFLSGKNERKRTLCSFMQLYVHGVDCVTESIAEDVFCKTGRLMEGYHVRFG
jgi:hypothetical protein